MRITNPRLNYAGLQIRRDMGGVTDELTVGAYRIRPENIRMDKCVYSGVYNTPLQHS